MKNFLIAIAVALMCLPTSAQKPVKATKRNLPWLDQSQNRIGTEKPRADFFAFETTDKAMMADKHQSERYLSLEGKWRFNFANNSGVSISSFRNLPFDILLSAGTPFR